MYYVFLSLFLYLFVRDLFLPLFLYFVCDLCMCFFLYVCIDVISLLRSFFLSLFRLYFVRSFFL